MTTRPDPHASYREHVSSEAEAVEETVSLLICSMPGCDTTTGCKCQRITNPGTLDFLKAIELWQERCFAAERLLATAESLARADTEIKTDLRAQLATARKALEEMAKWVDLPDQLPIQDRMSGEEHMYAEGINYGLQKAGRYARAALNSGEQKQSEDWPYPEGNPTCAQDLK